MTQETLMQMLNTEMGENLALTEDQFNTLMEVLVYKTDMRLIFEHEVAAAFREAWNSGKPFSRPHR
jgi:hypothetical protein